MMAAQEWHNDLRSEPLPFVIEEPSVIIGFLD